MKDKNRRNVPNTIIAVAILFVGLLIGFENFMSGLNVILNSRLFWLSVTVVVSAIMVLVVRELARIGKGPRIM